MTQVHANRPIFQTLYFISTENLAVIFERYPQKNPNTIDDGCFNAVTTRSIEFAIQLLDGQLEVGAAR